MNTTSPPSLPTLLMPARPIGEAKVWITSLGLATGLIMIFGLLAIIFYNGLEAFWSKPLYEFTVAPTSSHEKPITLLGSIAQERTRSVKNMDAHGDLSMQHIDEIQIFSGNRETTGQSFRFVDVNHIQSKTTPTEAMVISRYEGGVAIGYPLSIHLTNGQTISAHAPDFNATFERLVTQATHQRKLLLHLEKNKIGSLNNRLDATRRDIRLIDQSYTFSKNADGQAIATRKKDALSEEIPDPIERKKANEAQIAQDMAEYQSYAQQATSIRDELKKNALSYRLENGQIKEIPTGSVVYFSYPNQLGFLGKTEFFFNRLWEFISDNPREANTEGGIFPAIFGTFIMTVLMSLLVTPLGVIAAIYLREYAKQGMLVQIIRICVNNLAGVPSIVFGVFGLGFFVYFLGGGIDKLFFWQKLALDNTPTFGTPGILWASLTLALMTLPVVIVATEESLSSVPRGLREASLACGASKWQMIQRIILPGALPGILTGLILAMARGAGEVAPLMLTGVVKLAPSLPIDGDGPLIHLERKFMHLGFHIYDVGFQSPDSDAAKPMVFATTLLLIALVIVMNMGAIMLRNKLRKKHKASSF
ncbi:MAG: phosphate ABC transporter permease PstA [Akkermansia sp.]